MPHKSAFGGVASIADIATKDHDLLDGLADDDHMAYFKEADLSPFVETSRAFWFGRNVTERTTQSATYVELKEIALSGGLASGTYETSFELKTNNGSIYAYGRVYKNDGAVGTERSQLSTSYIVYTESLTFAGGDTYELYGKTTASFICYVKEQQIGGSLFGAVTAGK